MHTMLEKMGDRPAWMKIKKYRESGRRAELVLSLRKKEYWFPVSPSVYAKFQNKITESRYEGLVYLQDYIRRYRGYAGIWPSRRYENRNRIENTLLKESVSNSVFRLFDSGASIQDIAKTTSLSEALVQSLLVVSGKMAPDYDGHINPDVLSQ